MAALIVFPLGQSNQFGLCKPKDKDSKTPISHTLKSLAQFAKDVVILARKLSQNLSAFADLTPDQ